VAHAAGAQPTEATDQHRVVYERLGAVEQCVQELVVARCGHSQLFSDGLFLGARVTPPLLLEVENRAVAVAQRVVGFWRRACHDVMLCIAPRSPAPRHAVNTNVLTN
jgi:hypothetical protein